jgi:hypothetical protein
MSNAKKTQQFGHIKDLTHDPRNARKHTPRNVGDIVSALQEVGAARSIVIDEDGIILAGNATIDAAAEAGITKLQVVDVDGDTVVAVRRTGLTPAQKTRLALFDNRAAEHAQWDTEVLLALADEGALVGMWTDDEIAALQALQQEAPDGDGEGGAGSLAAKFGVPPFSVLNAREGWWQDRKRGWLSLGIASELGRDAAVGGSKMVAGYEGGERKTGLVSETDTSIFDPVLCELAYRWFCPPGGVVLDPFAGGSVRGIVASKLGRAYVGVELRAEQIAANRAQADTICADPMPVWQEGDSRYLDTLCAGLAADLVFTCPPYADLERYSDDPRDLSTMPYAAFVEAYTAIIAGACALLKPNRFACVVVGEVRSKHGGYYGFVPDTIAAFRSAGLSYYNEAILVTAAGSLPIRVSGQFTSSRKVGKTHQNVLVFVKGDAKKATQAVGPVEFGEIPIDEEATP